jgi:hypothetical protein
MWFHPMRHYELLRSHVLNKPQLKFGLFIAGLLIAMLMSFVGFRLLTKFIQEFQQGADPASIFRGHTLVVPEPENVLWVTTSPEEGRLPSQAQLEEIISAYWLAWQSVGLASLTNDLQDLKTYWAGSAYTQVLSGIVPDVRTDYVTHNHKLNLVYFSDDGSVVEFRDESFFIRRTIEDNKLSLAASAQITMTLDQGFWRIRHITFHYS